MINFARRTAFKKDVGFDGRDDTVEQDGSGHIEEGRGVAFWFC